ARAALFDAMRIDGAPHIGVLLDNVPDFTMWTGAAALYGATIVGINPTRRGEGLERDITHTECQLIVTEARHRELLDGLALGAGSPHPHSSPTSESTAPRTSTTSASRSRTSSLHRSDPTTPTTRSSAGSATRATKPTCARSRRASTAR